MGNLKYLRLLEQAKESRKRSQSHRLNKTSTPKRTFDKKDLKSEELFLKEQ